MGALHISYRFCSRWALALSAATLLHACVDDEDGLVPENFEGDLNFTYYLEGDMAIAEPRSHEIFLASGGTGPGTLYLNFDGGTIHRAGWSQNNAQVNSSFVPTATSVVPAFDHSHWNGTREAIIGKIAAGVAEDFSPYGVEVTTSRPAQAPYTMIMIGGRAADLGLTTNILGVAPLDASNWNANDVGFVFSDAGGDWGYSERHIAHVISHEIGHTVSLRHIDRPSDIMQPSACHCAQSWGAGNLVGDVGTQDDDAILKTVFPVDETGTDPIGWLDSIDTGGVARGWTCDPDASATSLSVQLYVGGIAGSGAASHTALANRLSEAAVNSACGGGNAHRFEVALPMSQCGQVVHVYGENASGTIGSTAQLMGSPRSMPGCPDLEPPTSCGAGNAWVEEGTHVAGTVCGNTCGGYHWSWCDYNGDGVTSDGWQFCLGSGWAACSYNPH